MLRSPHTRFFLSLASLLLGASALHGQNVSDLIISEALATPDSCGILDGYGRRCGWIELFNTSQGTVRFGGCFLTDDLGQPHKSPIPKTDARTVLGPRQAILFYAGGRREDGTFYTTLEPRPGSTLYLVSNDGRTVIDSLHIPASLAAGQSVQKRATDLRGKVFEAFWPAVPSPGAVNGQGEEESKVAHIKRTDPHGWILTLVSVSTVFAALALLWFIFGTMGDAFKRRDARKAAKTASSSGSSDSAASEEGEDGEAVQAAIALALHEYLSSTVHDLESHVLVCRTESGWNDKKLNFRKTPRR